MCVYIFVSVYIYICPCVFYCLYYCMEKIMIDMIDIYDDLCLHIVNIDHYIYVREFNRFTNINSIHYT